eukprot:scaffold12.g8179.t1
MAAAAAWAGGTPAAEAHARCHQQASTSYGGAAAHLPARARRPVALRPRGGGAGWRQGARRPPRAAPGEEVLASADGSPAAVGEGAPPSMSKTEKEALKTMQRLEVSEPMVEERAESAALSVGAAVAFGAGVWAVLGHQKGEEYFAGYLLEQALSVDNLFVFILVFNYFKTPVAYQNKARGWGLAAAGGGGGGGEGAGGGPQGAALVVWGRAPLFVVRWGAEGEEEEDEDLSTNYIIQLCKKVMSFSDAYDGDRFWTVENGVRVATPLLLVLLVVELSDVVFAVDSIPAVFGVTLDPFIVYTSNLFAILSLRGLYSFVATFMSKLRFLDKAVAVVLGFVGAKIIADFWGLAIPTDAALLVVAGILGLGVGASLLLPANDD